MSEQKITLDEVENGHSLLDLDNGYVIDVDKSADTQITVGTGSSIHDYPYVLPTGYVMITMHDTEGEEMYLIAREGMEVRVTDRYRV